MRTLGKFAATSMAIGLVIGTATLAAAAESKPWEEGFALPASPSQDSAPALALPPSADGVDAPPAPPIATSTSALQFKDVGPDNSGATLGDGTYDARYTPVRVHHLGNVKKIFPVIAWTYAIS